ncbi:MAG: hypothetical protein GPJ54_14410 [Candidatus Heimdallarchaeota archaeon]|nr:hypothetical protein [Candidatus Heimdallarchaeota archaeon]
MITYFNSFEDLKHTIYISLIEISDYDNPTASYSIFSETTLQSVKSDNVNNSINPEYERENNFQQVVVANGATY